MGTIAEKLSYLVDTKDLLKDRLNSLGAEITSSTTFRNYLTWLDTFYEEVGNKTDIANNGIVGRTNQKTLSGKNKINGVYSNILGRNRCSAETSGNGIKIIANNTSGVAYCSFAIDNSLLGETVTISMQSSGTKSPSAKIYYRNGSSLKTQVTNYWETSNDNTLQLPSSLPSGYDGIALVLYISQAANDIGDYAIFTNIQLEEGSQKTDFEEYCGGQPSPNPNYPQPINNLSGNVAYKVVGAQLYDYTDLKSSYSFLTYDNDGWYTVTYDTSGENGKYLNFTTPVSNLLNTDTDYLLVTEVKSLEYTGTGCLNPVDRWGQFATSTSYQFENISNNTTYTAIKTTKSDFSNLSGCLTSNVYVGANSTVTIKFRLSIIKDTSVTSSNFIYEPYIEPQTFTIPLGDIELCKIGDYKDIIKKSTGKNLFDKDNVQLKKTANFNGTDGNEFTITNSNTRTFAIVEVPSNTNITISTGNSTYSTSRYYIACLKSPTIEAGKTGDGWIYNNGTILTTSNTKYLGIVIDSRINGTMQTSTLELINDMNIQLEENSTPTDYEPYGKGKWYIGKQIGKVVLNGSENWQTELYTYYLTNFNAKPYSTFSPTTPYAYANYFKWGNGSSGSFVEGCFWYTLDGSKLRVQKENPLNLNSFKTWLSTHNVIVYYALVEPTTTEITQENYPSLYNALKQIQDYLTAYKINKEFILGYSSPEIEY